MWTAPKRKEVSFILWGIPGLFCLGLFGFSPLLELEDLYLWAGGGILGVLVCAIGHGLTCEAINARSRE